MTRCTRFIKLMLFVLTFGTIVIPKASAQLSPRITAVLSGCIEDSSGNRLAGATVSWRSETDSGADLSNDSGYYILKHVPKGVVNITFSITGYSVFEKNLVIEATSAFIQLPVIRLGSVYQSLNPVVVTGIKAVSVNGDTVSYKTSAFPVKDGSVVEDILKRLPGVEVDLDENVIIEGKKVTKIMIDGREYLGGDVLRAIQNLPADIVNKLQVIDDYGDQARLTGVRSGESSKTLNVVLQPDKKNGQLGRIEAGIGSGARYVLSTSGDAFHQDHQLSAYAGISNNSASGSDFSQNGGISFNNKFGQYWSENVTITTASQSPIIASETVQNNIYGNQSLYEEQNSKASSFDRQTTGESRLTFRPNNYTTLRITTTGNLQQNNAATINTFATKQQDSTFEKRTEGQTQLQDKQSGTSGSLGIYFESINQKSKNRFTVDASAGLRTSNRLDSSVTNTSVWISSVGSQSTLIYQTLNSNPSLSDHVNATFYDPVGKTGFFQLGYRFQGSSMCSDVTTSTPDSATHTSIFVDSLSEVQRFTTLTNDLQGGYLADLGKVDLNVTIDLQDYRQSGTSKKTTSQSYHYNAVITNLETTWRMSRSKRVSMQFASRPNFPSFQQLILVSDVSNPQYPIIGNPSLKPSQTKMVTIHYEQSSLRGSQYFGFGAGLSFSTTEHTIVSNFLTPTDSGAVIQATTFANVGNTNSTTGDYHLSLPSLFDKHLRINLAGNAISSNIITVANDVKTLAHAWTWNQAAHIQVLVPKVTEMDLSANYGITKTAFSQTNTPVAVFPSASLSIRSSYFIGQRWTVTYQLSQPFTGYGRRLQNDPAILNASIRLEAFAHSKVAFILSGYNLFNQSTSASQSITPTSTTQTLIAASTPFFLFTCQLRLQHFKR